MVQIKVTLTSQSSFRGSTFDEVVSEMRKHSWTPTTSNAEFMDLCMKRSMVLTGQQIQYHDAQTFLQELERVGVLTIEVVVVEISDGKSTD